MVSHSLKVYDESHIISVVAKVKSILQENCLIPTCINARYIMAYGEKDRIKLSEISLFLSRMCRICPKIVMVE